MKTETHIPFHCQNWEKMDDETKAAVVKMVELAYNHTEPPKQRTEGLTSKLICHACGVPNEFHGNRCGWPNAYAPPETSVYYKTFKESHNK